MMIKPKIEQQEIEIVKGSILSLEKNFISSSVEKMVEDDSYSSASSDAEVQSVIDSSCYERHDLTNSYVCTEVTALDKIETGG